ncbi:hypothetical protein fh0823_15390 [Francisella halioticida]|uniref:Uncharacterized protein n=1 Tax=Francisella halioticida TaxID=549298 RepID=A0ABN5AY92_9GAMM|nr:type VI secretion system protein IglI family protein [Francisella halioticida]ASG68510.1 hypothetical protein CDV26_09000 [Francisella halioticida]BCD91400.1 hypothetical protein fh0823_15390 [Francisella halioticida]
MVLDLINKAINEKEIYYKAEVGEFEPIYAALEHEKYLNVKDASLEQINKGCLDPRYVIYAEFGYWYDSTSFDVNSETLTELTQIHKFFLEKIEEGKIRSKVYLAVIEWLHTNMFAHAKFIRSNANIYFNGDKLALDSSFEKYILFIKISLPSINTSQLYQLKDIYKTFRVMREAEETDTTEDEQHTDISDIKEEYEDSSQHTDISDIKEEYEDSSLSSNNIYVSDQWSKLLRNIKIYRKLVSEKSWLKAAVVYQIIDSSLKEFDPTKYFPEILYPYLRDTASAHDQLMHQLSLSNHPLWLMLSQMFNSDPETFSTDDSLDGIKEILIGEINHTIKDDHQQYDTNLDDDEQAKPDW